VTSTTAPGGREAAAVSAAAALRRRCICQEDPENGPCACAQPVTREHVGWLRAYAVQHPERVIILSETEGTWMSALLDFLPPGATDPDRVLAWMRAPTTCPRPQNCGHRPAWANCSTCSVRRRPPPAALS
jgi:hypothetical protein